VWRAIYFQYLPIAVEADAAPSAAQLGAGRAPWACVSLADKLDTLTGLFAAGERPTGSRDPYGLRRAAHGILRILLDIEALTGSRIRVDLAELVLRAHAVGGKPPEGVIEFLAERLQYILEARGADKRNVRSVMAAALPPGAGLRPLDVATNLAALPEFTASAQFRQLATAFKRVRNIAKELGTTGPLALAAIRKTLKEPAERALVDEIDKRRPVIEAAALNGEHYRTAYAEAAGFEPAVARFFNEVFVMAEEPAVRQARLSLLRHLEQLILQLGDISEIVATES
jgi:glycyl-tRNA synthetase beta chain